MCFYGDFSDNDSCIYEEDAYVDDPFAFISNNDSYDKEWLLRCDFVSLYV
jgi:hypothetical protein